MDRLGQVTTGGRAASQSFHVSTVSFLHDRFVLLGSLKVPLILEAHWNPPGATPIRADCTVCHRKKLVRDAAHQGLPERSRDRVDGCSITPDIFLDSGTPAAPPRAVHDVFRAPPTPLE